MSELTLSEINVFPIKSLRGISLPQADLTSRGLRLDRRWMLVDDQGKFLSQRVYPVLTMLQVKIQGDQLEVHHVDYPEQVIEVSPNGPFESTIDVIVWQNICSANVYPKPVNEWFSKRTGIDCRLVYMPDSSRRPVDSEYQINEDIVSFADGFPCLIIGESSLADLNGRLENPVSMSRFRSNLVFSGGPAFAEDVWQEIRIGQVLFHVAKPCPRCVMITIDPLTGQKGVEPMQTLATYRKDATGGVMFGQNLLHSRPGTLQVGMEIEVISRK